MTKRSIDVRAETDKLICNSSSGSKRVRVEPGDVCSLDADNPDNDIWFEPRSVTDLTLKVVLSETETVTVHLHRVRVMEQSKWLQLRIEELIAERSEAHIVLSEDVGPFRTREEIQKTFDVMAGGNWPSPYGGPLYLRVLHALDYFEFVNIQPLFECLRLAKNELRKLTVRERVDLAKRYKLEWMSESVAEDIVTGVYSDGLSILLSDAVVTMSLVRHMFNQCTAAHARAKTAETTLLNLDILVTGYFESFNADSRDHCIDGEDCDHRPSDHEIDHEETDVSDYDGSALDVLRDIRRLV